MTAPSLPAAALEAATAVRSAADDETGAYDATAAVAEGAGALGGSAACATVAVVVSRAAESGFFSVAGSGADLLTTSLLTVDGTGAAWDVSVDDGLLTVSGTGGVALLTFVAALDCTDNLLDVLGM